MYDASRAEVITLADVKALLAELYPDWTEQQREAQAREFMKEFNVEDSVKKDLFISHCQAETAYQDMFVRFR